ncbi:apovitellenin-1-like [Spea bombifrons]|uniref:apovitellenin-1-like n=1 Tax=Spea bombifrons TaxID=233779 RepID=UPI0023495DAD|nr:apovitellenin-1-like [Spea bombifrons]
MVDLRTKSISKRHTQPDWLTTPEAIGTFIYETVNAVSPKAAEFLKATYQEQRVLEVRRFVISTVQTTADLIYETYKKMRSFWEPDGRVLPAGFYL